MVAPVLLNIQTLLANLIGFMDQRAAHYKQEKVLYSNENKIIENEVTKKYDQFITQSRENKIALEQALAFTGKLVKELPDNVFSRSVLPPKVYDFYIHELEEARKYIAGCRYDMSRLREAEKILIRVFQHVPNLKKLSSQKDMPAHL